MRIVLDGPLSVFQASGKYGVAMASFLPTLLHFEGWSLEAEVRFKRPRRAPRASSSRRSRACAATPGWPASGSPRSCSWLPGEIAALDEDWKAEEEAELIDLGGSGVLVPDFVFRHRQSGTRVVIEVFGFWRRGALKARLAQLRQHGPAEPDPGDLEGPRRRGGRPREGRRGLRLPQPATRPPAAAAFKSLSLNLGIGIALARERRPTVIPAKAGIQSPSGSGRGLGPARGGSTPGDDRGNCAFPPA